MLRASGRVSRLSARIDAGWGRVHAIEAEIERHVETATPALAAILLFDLERVDDEEYVIRAYRASLRAIRPQLVGLIAEDTDRVLAEPQKKEAMR
jgi:hypothetical protein